VWRTPGTGLVGDAGRSVRGAGGGDGGAAQSGGGGGIGRAVFHGGGAAGGQRTVRGAGFRAVAAAGFGFHWIAGPELGGQALARAGGFNGAGGGAHRGDGGAAGDCGASGVCDPGGFDGTASRRGGEIVVNRWEMGHILWLKEKMKKRVEK